MKYKHIRSQHLAIIVLLAVLPLAGFAYNWFFPAPNQPFLGSASVLPSNKGMVLADSASSCAGGYEVIEYKGQTICTHGPDSAPKGVDIRTDQPPEPEPIAPAGKAVVKASSVTCFGDGQEGKRVQLIYARAADKPDRYDTYAESFQLWAQEVNNVVRDSAIKTGGYSQVRFVHDSGCTPTIARVQLTATGDDSFSQTLYELMLAGYSRSDRKYLVWVDANVYCGLGTINYDDSQASTNSNNNQASWARVDTGCWGVTNASVEAHELMHMLGAVQKSAPNSDNYGHCVDEYDRLCYASGPGVTIKYVCGTGEERLYDCGNNDYFTTEQKIGDYLSTHWNTATSGFLYTEFASDPNSTRVYRFWNLNRNKHFYTSSYSEASSLINNPSKEWRFEGTSYKASVLPGCTGKSPVYRFWSNKNKSHFYTLSSTEKQTVIDKYDDDTWRYEGVAFCSYTSSTSGQKPLYRFWSDKYQSHFFTTQEIEKQAVISNYDDSIWRYEGVAYFVDQ